jgi:adenylate cyclase
VWSTLTKPFWALVQIGEDPSDDEDVRVQKQVLVFMAAVGMPVPALFWTVWMASHDMRTTSAVLAGIAVWALASLAFLVVTGRYGPFRVSMLLVMMFGQPLLGVLLGGWAIYRIVLSFFAVVVSLLGGNLRRSMVWFGIYLVVVLGAGVAQPELDPPPAVTEDMIATSWVFDTLLFSVLTMWAFSHMLRAKAVARERLRQEQERSERLLLNVLPREVAEQLKDDEQQRVAEHFEETSVLFADIVGFTPMTARMAPFAMVDLLNDIFTHFDELVEKHGVEKIRTIGDAYMVAAGVPRRRDDHAAALAGLALDMLAYIDDLPVGDDGQRLNFRIGINSGSLVGGVIGRKRFQYDVWGDAVNTASRMESHGIPGRIQITGVTRDQLGDAFETERRGLIEVKGKGDMETWFLLGRRGTSARRST